MANPNFRVKIPYLNAEKLLDLGEHILAKHKEDGQASVLKKLNMTDMENKLNKARKNHDLSEQLRKDKEEMYEGRNLALGINKNQFSTTPGKVLYYVCSVRSFLLGMFKGNEHQLGDWGFEVVEGSGKTVRVETPRSPDKLIELAQRIVEKHQKDGNRSILSGFNMVDMKKILVEAVGKHESANQLRRDAVKATEVRNIALGQAKNQKITTQGTVLFYVVSIRDVLLGFYKSKERKLGLWGFEVIEAHRKQDKEEKPE